MKCWLKNDPNTNSRNELFFSFQGITNPGVTELIFDFTNFQNPWSDISIESVRINSYSSADCSGNAQSSITASPLNFFPQQMPDANVILSSSSNVLGADQGVDLTVKFTPGFTTSLNGNGMIELIMPMWYTVQNKNNMAYNEQDRNTCSSPDFEVISSTPTLMTRNVLVTYKGLDKTKHKGSQLTLVCRGYKNPIVAAKQSGFKISLFDNEPSPHMIEYTSTDLFLNATEFLPADLQPQDIQIAPLNFTIG